jgi:hypothetical protein
MDYRQKCPANDPAISYMFLHLGTGEILLWIIFAFGLSKKGLEIVKITSMNVSYDLFSVDYIDRVL